MAFITALLQERKHFFLIITALCSVTFLVLIFSPFLLPIILAAIMALGFASGQERLARKFPKSIARNTLYSVASISTLGFAVLAVNALYRLYDLVLGNKKQTLLEMTEQALHKVDSWTLEALKQFSRELRILGISNESQLRAQFRSLSNTYWEGFLRESSELLASLPSFAMSLAVFTVVFWVLLSQRTKIYNRLSESNLMHKRDLDVILKAAQNSSYIMIFSNLFVSVVQALILSMGAWAVGLEEWSIIFMSAFFCSFFPVVGTAPIGTALTLLSFFLIGVPAGFFMLSLTLLAGVSDNFLRPYLVAKSDRHLNPWMSLVGLVGAIMLFGFAGLIIGPFILSFGVSMWSYFDKTVVENDTYKIRALAKDTPRKTSSAHA